MIKQIRWSYQNFLSNSHMKALTIRTHIIRKLFKSNSLLRVLSNFWSCHSNFGKKILPLHHYFLK